MGVRDRFGARGFGARCVGVLAALTLLAPATAYASAHAAAGSERARSAPVASEPPGPDTDSPQGLATYLGEAFSSIDGYWQDYFRAHRLEGPSVFYATPLSSEDSFTSRCAEQPVTHDTPTFFYCAADGYTTREGDTFSGGIYFPVTTAMGLRRETGDFALATVMAHEFGHEVQQELMEQLHLRDIVQRKDGAPVLENGRPVKVKESELLADCYSGNWSKYAHRQGLVATANLAEAVVALRLAADKEFGVGDPHGSKDERTAAFTLGYTSGDPLRCAHRYWVTETWE
ncbi:neutral zinc metallopeptidase [Streptomyces sp. NPDC093093]|uniref:neutral zinc metallopeptidase n=1 Tax=Streptomyces sp. NPDC093093 TaxID=3366025 RepID=UPI0038211C70